VNSERFHHAWQKIRYGRRYSDSYELVDQVRRVAPILERIEDDGNSSVDAAEAELCEKTATALLRTALKGGKKLREIAAALEAEMRKDPVQVNLLRAYMQCSSDPERPPTLAEIKLAHKRRFGRNIGRTDQSLRKTLRMLALPLRPAKRGPRKGSRPLIRN
jgi:hypothetical protein